MTDRLNIYPDAVREAFNDETVHQTSQGFAAEINTNIIERFHGTLKQRTKILRHFKVPESASTILDGWIVHYNFFGRHQALDGKSPADRAGIGEGITNWADILDRAMDWSAEKSKIARPTLGGAGCLPRNVEIEDWRVA